MGTDGTEADKQTELFLSELEQALVGRFDTKVRNKATSAHDSTIKSHLKNLRAVDDVVVVPADKTNRFLSVLIDKYIQQ